MKKLTLLTLTLLLTALAQLTAPPVQAEVSISDGNLANAIRETLGLPTDAVITADAMRELTELEASGKEIADLTGLEHAVNLTSLYLGGNTGVSDVSPLAALTRLTSLSLGNTAVSDVSPLLGLNLTGTSWNSIGLWLDGCPLSYASFHTHIPAMQAKGIQVRFDNVVDVNGDDVVNIQDLVLVSGQLGETGEDIPADVNRDGVVNILDLVFVAGAFN